MSERHIGGCVDARFTLRKYRFVKIKHFGTCVMLRSCMAYWLFYSGIHGSRSCLVPVCSVINLLCVPPNFCANEQHILWDYGAQCSWLTPLSEGLFVCVQKGKYLCTIGEMPTRLTQGGQRAVIPSSLTTCVFGWVYKPPRLAVYPYCASFRSLDLFLYCWNIRWHCFAKIYLRFSFCAKVTNIMTFNYVLCDRQSEERRRNLSNF